MGGQIRRGLVDTAHGQMHYRHIGQGTPYFLIHWGPWSSKQYAPIMPLLADAGYAPYAFDVLGYGFSDFPEVSLTTTDHADALIAAIDTLRLSSGVFHAGHLPTVIATEVALKRPDLVRKMVLDGAPLLTEAVVKAMMTKAEKFNGKWVYSPDGAHERYFWDATVNLMEIWDPSFRVTADTVEKVHRYMADYLLYGVPKVSKHVVNVDAAARLKELTIPVLALTADNEPLRTGHETLLGVLKKGQGHIFPGAHPHHYPERAAEYVAVIRRFLDAA